MSTAHACTEVSDSSALSQLILQAKAGNETAFAALIVMHQPMANAIARRWHENMIPREDAVAECRLAFISSFGKYDPARVPLTAFWAAKASNALVDYYRKNLKVGRDNGKIAAAFMEETSGGTREVDVQDFAKRHGLSRSRAHRIATWAPDTVNIHVTGENGESYERIKADDVGPAERAARESDADAIAKLAKTLPAREWRAVESYYGLDGTVPRTFAEIGHELGVTSQRVQQIISKALARLRRDPIIAQELAPA